MSIGRQVRDAVAPRCAVPMVYANRNLAGAACNMRKSLVVRYRVVVTFDDLQEQRRSVLHVLREQLQQVTVVVEVDEDAQLLKLETYITSLATRCVAKPGVSPPGANVPAKPRENSKVRPV